MALDAKLAKELISGAADVVSTRILTNTLTLYSILEGVKFPKGTKLKSYRGVLEVHSPDTPVYEIHLKETY